MAAAPPPRRAALFLDFDNVFGALAEIDEWAAWEFANNPGRWLAWFAAGPDGGAAESGRRLLLRRCYLNAGGFYPLAPQGGLAAQLGVPRVYFSRFRTGFVRAGFQVVDCPALTAAGKNAADITMVLDILDALSHATRFDEFLILASDADFTPLLHRIRAHDRQVLVVAHKGTARAFRAATDVALELDEFAAAALGRGSPDAATPKPRPAPVPADDIPVPAPPEAQQAVLLRTIHAILAASPTPLRLQQLGQRLRQECGPWVGSTRYGGAGSLQRLIEGQPDLALEISGGGGWLFDPARHELPSARKPEQPGEVISPAGPSAGPGFHLSDDRSTGFAPAAPALPSDGIAAPASPAAQQTALLRAIRAALAESQAPLHLGTVGQRLRRECGPWVSSSRYGGTGSLQRLVEGQPGMALELGPGGGWLFDPTRHERPSAQGTEQPDVPILPAGDAMRVRATPMSDGIDEDGPSAAGAEAGHPPPALPGLPPASLSDPTSPAATGPSAPLPACGG